MASNGNTTFQFARGKADEWAARYFKLRDCLATTGTPTHCRCISCHKIKPVEEIQNGHFHDRDCMALRYDPENNNGQCAECNMDRVHKMLVHEAYRHGLIRKRGEEVIDRLWKKKKNPRLYSAVELMELAHDFHKQFINLSKR